MNLHLAQRFAQGLYVEEEFEIFPSPKAYVERRGRRIYVEGRPRIFFQVPWPLYRRELGNFLVLKTYLEG